MIHIDIKKYYPTMDHQVALKTLKSKLPQCIYKRAEAILNKYDGDVGYCAGSQLVQILGISVLDKLDHYIKEKLRVKCYIRYMDDLILVVPDNPEYYIHEIETQLNLMNFSLNLKKTKYVTLWKGDTFLGFKFSLSDTGRVRMCLSKDNLKRRRQKIRKKGNYQTLEEFDRSFQTWLSYASRSTSQKSIQGVIDYYKNYRRLLYEK